MTRQIDTDIAGGRSTRLDGVRAAVTGGTSGLGLALVGELLRRGARVAFVARTRERVEAVARAHPGAHGIAGDVGRKDDIHPIALQIAGQSGRARCAGEQRVEPRTRAARAAGRHRVRGFRAGARAPTCSGRSASPGRCWARSARRRARAAEASWSISRATPPINAYPMWGAYGASKAALHHMSRIWDEELGAEGIRFLSLDPGRHGHAAARGGGARRRSVDAQAPGDGRARAGRCDRGRAPGAALGGRARGSGRRVGCERTISGRHVHDCGTPPRPTAAGCAPPRRRLRAGASRTRLDRSWSIFCGRAIW